jgi:hypothetical protein
MYTPGSGALASNLEPQRSECSIRDKRPRATRGTIRGLDEASMVSTVLVSSLSGSVSGCSTIESRLPQLFSASAAWLFPPSSL